MAKCAGCGKEHTEFPEYQEEDVRDDGSYANGMFVCNICYIKLIGAGLDVGSAEVLQKRASILIRGQYP